MCQAKAHHTHERNIVDAQHTLGRRALIGRHDDQQLVVSRGSLADIVDDGHMLWQCGLHVVCTFIASLYEQRRRLAVHESDNAFIHVIGVAYEAPSVAFGQRVQRPQPCVVALRGDDLMSVKQVCDLVRQGVGAAHMTAQHCHHIVAHAVDAHHRRVGVLVLDIGSNGADTNAHGADEHEGIIVLPTLANIAALKDCCIVFAMELLRDEASRLAHLYNCYLHLFTQIIKHLKPVFRHFSTKDLVYTPSISQWDDNHRWQRAWSAPV